MTTRLLSSTCIDRDGNVYDLQPTSPAGARLELAPEPIGAFVAWSNAGEAPQRVSFDEAVSEGWLVQTGGSVTPRPHAQPADGFELMDRPRPRPGGGDDYRDPSADSELRAAAGLDPSPAEPGVPVFPEIAPPPPRQTRQRGPQALLTDEDFAVLDLLAEADSMFMGMPTGEPEQRQVWRTHFHVLEALVMRKAAIRAYPQRFVGE